VNNLLTTAPWTVVANTSRVQAFHMCSQHSILIVHWQDKVCNSTISQYSSLSHITDVINTCSRALCGHIVHLSECTPAHHALHLAMNICTGIHPWSSWKCPHRRPCDAWLKPFLSTGDVSIAYQWCSAIQHGHGLLTQILLPDTQPWWRWCMANL